MIVYATIYNLAVRCYVFFVFIASFFNNKAKLFIAGRKDLLPKIASDFKHETRPVVWMHCASLGEFEQGRPVLEQLRMRYASHAIVLTFFSPSGYEPRKNYDKADYIYYLPIDSRRNASAFLNIIRPQLCLFVKYEFWYHYYAAIKKSGASFLLVSAIFRKDQLFFKWYGSLQRKMLGAFTHMFLQNEASALLLHGLGFNNTTVNGDTRFDRVIEAASQLTATNPVAPYFKADKIIVAGSTWKEDEEFLLKVITALPATWKLILVPHEVDEDHIKKIEALFTGLTQRWTTLVGETDKRVLIINQVGLLLTLYRFADICWIGGGFGREGVHNVLEAAVYGKPCFWGPVYSQFEEAKALVAQGGGMSVGDPSLFVNKIAAFENNTQDYNQMAGIARQYVLSHGGATDSIINYIAEKNLLTI